MRRKGELVLDNVRWSKQQRLVSFTVRSRGRLSLTAPTHPRHPITMVIVPTAMSRLAADKEGREDESVAKFPWVTESQTPTPRIPHPPNCREEKQSLA